MHPYRYRCAKKPPQARACFAKCGKLGEIQEIMGRGASSVWSRHEWEVHVRGRTGQARFTGLCWGDEGEGAKALRDLLLFLGLSATVAEKVAFHAPRHEYQCWQIYLYHHIPDKPIHVSLMGEDRNRDYVFRRLALWRCPSSPPPASGRRR
jgi:hypothetical protein